MEVPSLMPPRATMFDDIALDLADWIDRTAEEIAQAMAPRGVQPFAAHMSSQQKMDYYKSRLFNPDGSPNMTGRAAELQRLGPEGFANVYKAVLQAYPELRQASAPVPPAPRAGPAMPSLRPPGLPPLAPTPVPGGPV
jgi:hypothetical protein